MCACICVYMCVCAYVYVYACKRLGKYAFKRVYKCVYYYFMFLSNAAHEMYRSCVYTFVCVYVCV